MIIERSVMKNVINFNKVKLFTIYYKDNKFYYNIYMKNISDNQILELKKIIKPLIKDLHKLEQNNKLKDKTEIICFYSNNKKMFCNIDESIMDIKKLQTYINKLFEFLKIIFL